MFDNLLYQSASDLLSSDIKKNCLPNSILLSGPASSGKLTCALEIARILSCANKTASWTCTCPSCLEHKALQSPNVLIVGSSDRTLEIAAAKANLLFQNANNTSHLEAARYLFIRSVRKLTVRFSSVLWADDDKLSKFSSLIADIEESLEEVSPNHPLPDGESLEKICSQIEKNCIKLESSFLYDAIPVAQIRHFSSWARVMSNSGQKVVIIENAERMADSARNALLKILEEPPSGTTFILTTSSRGSILPTILSRVRTYTLFNRNPEEQKNVINRVFHYDMMVGESNVPKNINDFLQTYLPIKPDLIKSCAKHYFETVAQGHVPDITLIAKTCGSFEPRVLLQIFFKGIIDCQQKLLLSSAGSETCAQVMDLLRNSYNRISFFNQNPIAALEELTRNLMRINKDNNGILQEALL